MTDSLHQPDPSTASEPEWNKRRAGHVWRDYSFVVYLSDSPSLGRVAIYVNNKLVKTIAGLATVKYVNAPTYFYLNVVDFGGLFGTADYDDLRICAGTTCPSAGS
jgi:hypothetical protein